MPPPAELRKRPQGGISWVQKVAAVEIGFRGAPRCFQGTGVYMGEGSPVLCLFQKDRSRRFHSVWTPFDTPFLRNTKIGKKNNLDWASG